MSRLRNPTVLGLLILLASCLAGLAGLLWLILRCPDPIAAALLTLVLLCACVLARAGSPSDLGRVSEGTRRRL